MQQAAQILFLLQIVSTKICWEHCQGSAGPALVETLDIDGCRRRADYPERKLFWCEGREGPPCTALSGDTLTIRAALRNNGSLGGLSQYGEYMTSYLNIPWPGMEEDACIFLGHPQK